MVRVWACRHPDPTYHFSRAALAADSASVRWSDGRLTGTLGPISTCCKPPAKLFVRQVSLHVRLESVDHTPTDVEPGSGQPHHRSGPGSSWLTHLDRVPSQRARDRPGRNIRSCSVMSQQPASPCHSCRCCGRRRHPPNHRAPCPS